MNPWIVASNTWNDKYDNLMDVLKSGYGLSHELM